MEKNLALEKLNLLIKEEDIWLSSMNLATITDKEHFHVMRDIREDIVEGVNKTLNIISTQSKFGLSSQENLIEFLNQVNKELDEFDEDSIYVKAIRDIKVEELERDSDRGKIKYYLLNKEASLMILSRYSPEVRIIVSNLFFKSLDLLKSKGYVINDADD